MSPSWRKPAGMAVILLLIGLWAWLAVTLVEQAPIFDNLLFYVVAGVAWIWILPLRPLLRWMETGCWRPRDAPP